ncbi:MAG: ABC transporter permease, partial [Actinobacteria bacterium]|nr:ABC transporter permease [Actinomycetota bacterium]
MIFVWMFDVFLGPAMNATEALVVRLFPTHFPTLFMLDAASGHGGPLTDVGWTLVWTVGAVLVAATVFARGTRPPESAAERARARNPGRLQVAFRHAFVEYRRNPSMWFLMTLLPVGFISLAFLTTADDPAPVSLTEDGVTTRQVLSMIEVHGAIMVPITV